MSNATNNMTRRGKTYQTAKRNAEFSAEQCRKWERALAVAANDADRADAQRNLATWKDLNARAYSQFMRLDLLIG